VSAWGLARVLAELSRREVAASADLSWSAGQAQERAVGGEIFAR
jgi:hypothetical protein